MITARPNAFDIGADENMEKGSSQNSLSINETTTPKRTVIKIGGMHCAGCVNAIQGYISDLPGINKIEVNLANEKANLEYDESKIRLNTIAIALVVICAASLLVVMFPRVHAQIYLKTNSSALMQFQNVILHPSLGSHLEHIVTQIHQINQDSNRTAHLIVINHVNNTGCYVECLSAYNYTISVLGIYPNPRIFKGSEAGTDVTLGQGNYNVTAPEVSTFYWKDISPDCSGVINAGETKRCIITNSYANDIKTWTDEATNIKIQFSYLPLYPFVGNNTALNFKVTDLKTGVPLELAHVHVVIIKNVTANFTSSRTVSNKGDFVTYDNITSSHGTFFIRYQFEQEGMHQIIARINTKNGGVALASFGVPVLFPE